VFADTGRPAQARCSQDAALVDPQIARRHTEYVFTSVRRPHVCRSLHAERRTGARTKRKFCPSANSATGVLLSWLSRWWERRCSHQPVLFTTSLVLHRMTHRVDARAVTAALPAQETRFRAGLATCTFRQICLPLACRAHPAHATSINVIQRQVLRRYGCCDCGSSLHNRVHKGGRADRVVVLRTPDTRRECGSRVAWRASVDRALTGMGPRRQRRAGACRDVIEQPGKHSWQYFPAANAHTQCNREQMLRGSECCVSFLR
jgi:hypothetical protein